MLHTAVSNLDSPVQLSNSIKAQTGFSLNSNSTFVIWSFNPSEFWIRPMQISVVRQRYIYRFVIRYTLTDIVYTLLWTETPAAFICMRTY